MLPKWGKETTVWASRGHAVTMAEAVAEIQALVTGRRMRVITLNPEMVIPAGDNS